MACTAIQDYTGTQLIQTHMGEPVGAFDSIKIDADISTNGDGSQMNLAKIDFQQWVTTCGTDLDALSANQCVFLEQALRWYMIYRYRKFDIQLKSKEKCGADDYRGLYYACSQVRDFLCRVSSCLLDLFNDSLESRERKEQEIIIPDGAFGVTSVTTCGPDESEINQTFCP